MNNHNIKLTNWCVVTGPPCSGKTTLINCLRDKGYKIANEIAREILEKLLEDYGSGAIHNHILALQESILAQEKLRELHLNANDLIFFDRALPDSIAYFKLNNLCPTLAIETSKIVRYRHVFLLEPLPLVKDKVRQESTDKIMMINDLLKNTYDELGYKVISVPVDTVEKRAEYILQYV